MKLERGNYSVVAGRAYRSPKEIWGFREKVPRGKPLDVAKAFLKANVETLKIKDALPRLSLRALIRGRGATHVILQQQHEQEQWAGVEKLAREERLEELAGPADEARQSTTRSLEQLAKFLKGKG